MSHEKPCDGNCQPTCCETTPPVTVPMSVHNPAGLRVLRGRVGDHRSFFESLRRRLSSRQYPQLSKLTTRSLSDPTIALLDSWSVVGDVLTFYNERYLQEAYHRTATEVRSLQELSKLIGYRPGPGVASSVYLAFTLEKSPEQASLDTLIRMGTKVQSVPGAEESAQTFETTEDFVGRPEWSTIRPRQTIPQQFSANADLVFIEGIGTNIKLNDRLILVGPNGESSQIVHVQEMRTDVNFNWTELILTETIASIGRFRREIQASLTTLLATAEKTPVGFVEFFEKFVEPLNTIFGSDFALLQKWHTLSELDKGVSRWLSITKETYNHATKLRIDLQQAGNPATELTRILTESVAKCDVVFKEALSIQREHSDLATYALEAFKNSAALEKSEDVTLAALTKYTDDMRPPSPAAHCNVHFSHLDIFYNLVKTLAALGAEPSEEDQKKVSKMREEDRLWWGITKKSFKFNARSERLRNIVESLSKLGEPTQANPPFQVLKECFDWILTSETSDTEGPHSDRKKEIVDLLVESQNKYIASLDDSTKFELIVSGEADKILKSFIDPELALIKTETRIGQKFLKALEVRDTAKAAIDSTIAIVSAFVVLTDHVNQRRELFAQRAESIKHDFSALAGHEAFEITLPVLDAALKKDGELFLTSLLQTVKEINFLLPKLNILASRTVGPQLRLIEGLSRELKNLIALDGSATTANSPTTSTTSTTGAGIGSATQSDSSSNRPITIRNADLTLTIPSNTAADVVAQLTSTLGIASTDELRAKWKGLRFGVQESYVSLISSPISLFGAASSRPVFDKELQIRQPTPDWVPISSDFFGRLHLQAELPQLQAPTEIFIQHAEGLEVRRRVSTSRIVSRADYGLTSKATLCELDPPNDWRSKIELAVVGEANPERAFRPLRETLVCVPLGKFPLSEMPLRGTIGANAQILGLSLKHDFEPEASQIELDDIYLSLRSGHKVIIEGERSEIEGVIAREVAEIVHVAHKWREVPGDRVHTRVYFSQVLKYTYKRETVVLYANIVGATHGETTSQILGNGDASKAFQTMALGKGPLTYLPAPNETGVESTLAVRVNDIQWHEIESLLDAPADSRNYVVQDQPEAFNSVQFGDGKTGARLPSGNSNVVANYRTGLGKAGNVRAKSITNLVDRPMGVKEVTNPLPATGGADPETVEQIRANAPLAVMALDRLVSTRDYADFARNFAGIDKAIAMQAQVNAQPTICVTLAGAADVRIEGSELIRNLLKAYQRLGDPLQRVQVQTRELLLLFLGAKVRLKPDYRWESVKPQIQQSLYDSFSFARSELGQPVYLSDVYSAIQKVAGVAYVDVDLFGTLSQEKFRDSLKQSQTSSTTTQPTSKNANGATLSGLFATLVSSKVEQKLDAHSGKVNSNHEFEPAQLIYLSPDVSDSLYLDEDKS